MDVKDLPTIGLPKVGAKQFLKEVRSELKKVIWPTREDIIKLTIVVIIISVLVGAFIGGLDILFLRLSGLLY